MRLPSITQASAGKGPGFRRVLRQGCAAVDCRISLIFRRFIYVSGSPRICKLVRKEDSNLERKSLIMRFLSLEEKLPTRTCTRTHTASNPRGLELPQYWHGLRSGASVVPIKRMIADS